MKTVNVQHPPGKHVEYFYSSLLSYCIKSIRYFILFSIFINALGSYAFMKNCKIHMFQQDLRGIN